MNRPLPCFALTTVLIPAALQTYSNEIGPPARRAPSTAQTETAEWVARQVDERDAGRDARLELKMRLFDRRQRVRERDLTILTKRHSQSPHPSTGSESDGDRVLIRFTYPNDIKGTAFLVWEHPTGEDERFLYLPALGRVRRIAGAEAQDSFVGSDFTYEDFSGREFADYSYGMIARNAEWQAPDGQRLPAYRIESRARESHARFPRVVSTVRKDSFVVVAAEIFNRRDEREKTYEVRRLDRVQGIWTLGDVIMTNIREGTRTELSTISVQYNVGLQDAEFSRRELERR